jgi:hypothetical protein
MPAQSAAASLQPVLKVIDAGDSVPALTAALRWVLDEKLRMTAEIQRRFDEHEATYST